MRIADFVTASFLMVVGGVDVFDAVRLGIGWGTDGPQSGFFPFWLGVFMIAACAVIVVQAARRPDAKPFVTRTQLGPVLKVLWPAVALVVLTQWLGLYVSAALYTGFYMRWIGRHSWLAVFAVGILFPLATFFVFEKWFLVPMPKGPLEAWLGQ
jgi:putative tricarboxylic transport membrane protein